MPPAQVSADVLRKLHRLQRQLADLNERLARGPRLAKAREANLVHQEELLAKAQAEAKTFRVATDGKQLQLKSKEDKVKEWKVKLNAATSNREYQALKEQIAADEMANSVLADEILEALDKLDGLHAQIVEGQTAVAKAREESARAQEEVQQQEPVLRADVARVEAELQECEASLPPELAEPYHRVVRKKGDDALCPANDVFCGGCHQQITLNMLNALRMNQPVFCRSCGRLLYLPE
jgi:uncharacterized protein